MGEKRINYARGTEDAAYGPLNRSWDVTPSATAFEPHTRAIMVSDDDTTVTGIMKNDNESHTTFPLKAGVLYPFEFKIISAVSGSGTVKGYA